MLEKIVNALVDSVYEIAASTDGNHVISKCLEVKPVSLRLPMYRALIAVADQVSDDEYE